MAVQTKIYEGQEAAVVCDECGQFEEVPGLDELSFFDKFELIQLLGWTARREKDAWRTYCNQCVHGECEG